MRIKKLLYPIIFISFFLLCKKTEEIKKIQEEKKAKQTISKPKKKSYLLDFNDPQAKEIIETIEKREKNFFSYQAKIKISTKVFFPKKQNLNLSGKIYYNSKTREMKIDLENAFFGFKIATLKTNGKQMELKIPKKKKIISRLREVYLNEVNFYLPFPGIYFLLSNQNLSFFNSSQAKIDLTMKKISFKNNKNNFSYFYNDKYFFEKMIIDSRKQKLKANIKIKKYVELPELLEIKLFHHTNKLFSQLEIKLKINKLKN